MANKAPSPNKNAAVPIGFKSVFWVAVCLTALSLIVAVYLATRPTELQNEQTRKIVETCDTTWKMGFGSILGLLGGKSLP
ncbi:MAG TPA: hypothetical protein VN688_01400 [Gemmataceae bacterium]|nr:hypothetical protein [Gemmataceae bacterium]